MQHRHSGDGENCQSLEILDHPLAGARSCQGPDKCWALLHRASSQGVGRPGCVGNPAPEVISRANGVAHQSKRRPRAPVPARSGARRDEGRDQGIAQRLPPPPPRMPPPAAGRGAGIDEREEGVGLALGSALGGVAMGFSGRGLLPPGGIAMGCSGRGPGGPMSPG